MAGRSGAGPLAPLGEVVADGLGAGGVLAVEAGVVGQENLVVADGWRGPGRRPGSGGRTG